METIQFKSPFIKTLDAFIYLYESKTNNKITKKYTIEIARKIMIGALLTKAMDDIMKDW